MYTVANREANIVTSLYESGNFKSISELHTN